RRKDRQLVFHFAKWRPPRRALQTFRSFPETAVSIAEEVVRHLTASIEFVAAGVPPAISKAGLPQTAYNNSFSNSSRRCSNKRNVLSIGADVVMSTPAAFNVSSGNFEPPERRKLRYASTFPGSSESTRCESATAAEIPVAYL